jgi:hypothetical protein
MARMLNGAEARNGQLIQKEWAVRANRHLLWSQLMDLLILATIIFYLCLHRSDAATFLDGYE